MSTPVGPVPFYPMELEQSMPPASRHIVIDPLILPPKSKGFAFVEEEESASISDDFMNMTQ